MAYNSFVLYKDWQSFLPALSLEEKGILFESIYNFQCSGEIPDFSDNHKTLQGIFNFMLSAFIRDNEKYTSKCEQMRANANKRKQNGSDNDNVNDYDNINDYDNVNNNENEYVSVSEKDNLKGNKKDR